MGIANEELAQYLELVKEVKCRDKRPMSEWYMFERLEEFLKRLTINNVVMLFFFVVLIAMWFKVNERTLFDKLDSIVGHSISHRSRQLAESHGAVINSMDELL